MIIQLPFYFKNKAHLHAPGYSVFTEFTSLTVLHLLSSAVLNRRFQTLIIVTESLFSDLVVKHRVPSVALQTKFRSITERKKNQPISITIHQILHQICSNTISAILILQTLNQSCRVKEKFIAEWVPTSLPRPFVKPVMDIRVLSLSLLVSFSSDLLPRNY